MTAGGESEGRRRAGRPAPTVRRAWIACTALVALVLTGLVCTVRPVRLPTPQPLGMAAFPRRSDGHAVLLLCAAEAYRGGPPRRPTDRPADLEWVNILTQALGGCDVLPVAEFVRDPVAVLQQRQLLVLGRSTAAELDSSLYPALREAVRHGLEVLVEMPPPRWAARMGLLLQAEDTAPRLTWPHRPRGRQVALEFRPPVPQPLPLPCAARRYAPVLGDHAMPRPVLDLDGRTVVWRVDEGDGCWLVVGVDWGALSLIIRQGQPSDRFRLPRRNRAAGARGGATADLVACAALQRGDVPWLDAWAAALFDPELARAPWPVVWPAPFPSDGFALVTHADEGRGEHVRWMLEAQSARHVPSTVFLAPAGALPAQGRASALAAEGVQLGLQVRLPSAATWHDPRAPRARLGFWRLRPLGRLPGVVEQRDALATALPGSSLPTLSRTHGLQWPAEVDVGWSWLVGAGLRGDSSYGPSAAGAGWLFGSALPFCPLDRRGIPFPIWEVPLLARDTGGGVDRAQVDRWLRTNAVGGHGPIVLAFHAEAYRDQPSAELFQLWEAVPALAQRHNHRLVTMGELLDFWELRRHVRLRWRYAGRLLQVDIEAPPGAAARGLGLSLPLRWHDLTLTGWEASWPEAQSRRASGFDGEVRLFSLPDGQGRLLATYR